MIRAIGLTKEYGGSPVLAGLDFEVEPGERMAVLGLNGAGKTTLLRCLLGLVDFGGDLLVDDRPAGPGARKVRAGIAYVPQLPPVFDLDLGAFLELVAELRRIPWPEVAAAVERLGLGLDEHGAKPMARLSGGMLQKTYLALALAAEAPLVLLDEPTASLDPGSRRDVLRHLAGLGERTTLVLASHRLEEIEPLADRLVVLHEGRIVHDGGLADLWARTGARLGLWLAVPPRHRADVVGELERHPAVRRASANGSGIDVEVEAASHLALLAHLHGRELPVREVRTRPPSLDDLMERLLAADRRAEGAS